MNTDFPPLQLGLPVQARRRREPPRPVPTAPEITARRAEIAQRLRQQVAPLARRFGALGDAERKAIFYKLEHDGPIDAKSLGLRPVAEPSDRFTLAIPRDNTFERVNQRLEQFETGVIRSGMVPHAQTVSRLVSVAEGSPTDRLSFELFDRYNDLVREPSLILEVELLSVERGAVQRRTELHALREALRTAVQPNGAVYEHEEMKGSCRVVVRCSGAAFRTLVEGAQWQRTITWFEPRPEFQTFSQTTANFRFAALGPTTAPEPNAPVVCVVDTGVSAGNPFLQPVARRDLIRSFLGSRPEDPADEFGHGSGVASLVSYYALNIAAGGTNTGRVWIASARVLDARNEADEGRLFSVALTEVVKTFAPLGVKIFNLSVNIRNGNWNEDARRTTPRRSWIARRIDQLSREHDVVFVISAGNISTNDVRLHHAQGLPYPRYLLHNDSSLLDPAQAALAITVGALAGETLIAAPGRDARALAEREQPAPFTRSGPGILRDIKPEVVEYGGNYIIDEGSGLVRETQGCSVAIATHQLTPALKYASGTSFAAPRVSHKLALIERDLRELGIQPSAPLLKAFLVNSARLPLTGEELETFAVALSDEQRNWLRVLGYGLPDADRATGCDAYSVVMYYQGSVEADQIMFIEVPVPAALQDAQVGTRKRLTVTVAYSPEVQQWGLEQYIGTALKWRVFRGDVDRDSVVAAMSRPEDEDGEAQEVPQELAFNIKVTQRSRGTVQNDVSEWTQHRREYSANSYTLAVAAFQRWQRLTAPVPFAVVVRLEETSRTAPVYTAVRNSLVAIQVRARG